MATALREGGRQVPRMQLFTAVRYTLEELAASYPGRAVEVRVPPAGAVQILEGTVHRRGTPPAVVEMDPAIWLALTVGLVSWDLMLSEGVVSASGNRCDLGPILPLF
nr:sterol carrier family protein [Boudabousia tangfeifanii]